ncbi:MAG: P-loop NTPase [Candidatus Hodarchaeales archaeon]
MECQTIVGVASGKGGTGKTTVAVNLSLHLAEQYPVALFDLDVEEPNDNHFLYRSMVHFQDVGLKRPEVDEESCTHCGICAELCEFNALAVLPDQVMIFDELCHGCGLCSLACPVNAITEHFHKLGEVKRSENPLSDNTSIYKQNLTFFEGTLNVGEAIATPIIHELKKIAFDENKRKHIILDLPPGSACPVVEGLSDIDYVILVTEPTPAGEHDLFIAIELVKQLEVPFGIISNRSDVGDDRINRLVEENGYTLLLEIPHDNEILHLYSRGLPLVGETKRFNELFEKLWKNVKDGKK